jgi:uncharacterized protein YlxW (UPF0749 family)
MKHTPIINPNDLMLISRTHYNELLQEINDLKERIQQDNQEIVKYQCELNDYHHFFKLYQKFMQK